MQDLDFKCRTYFKCKAGFVILIATAFSIGYVVSDGIPDVINLTEFQENSIIKQQERDCDKIIKTETRVFNNIINEKNDLIEKLIDHKNVIVSLINIQSTKIIDLKNSIIDLNTIISDLNIDCNC